MEQRTEQTSKAKLALRAFKRKELTWTELQRELEQSGCRPELVEALALELGV